MPAPDNQWAEPDWQSTSEWCRMRNLQRIRCVIDVLGEYSSTEAEVYQAFNEYLRSISAISKEGLNASVSVKLTTLGALLNKEKCRELALAISREAKAKNVRFEMDMEGRELVDFTLDVAKSCARESGDITLALQAYLDRTPTDLGVALDNGIRPRLVKGAYTGDTTKFEDIQERFRRLFAIALNAGGSFLVGTHDPQLVQWVKSRSIGSGVEFGFLKGLADRTKVELASQGWAVSEYVPFGAKRGAYELRRRNYLRQLNKLGRAPVP